METSGQRSHIGRRKKGYLLGKTCVADLAFRAESSFSEHCLTPIPWVAESIDRKAQRLTLKNGWRKPLLTEG
ncbi:hypothetical protein CS8_015700 [Cupriavidus sp. 8B]